MKAHFCGLALALLVPAVRPLDTARAHGTLRSSLSASRPPAPSAHRVGGLGRLRCLGEGTDPEPDGANSDNVASSVGGFKPGGDLFSNPLPQPSGKRVDEIVDFPTRLRFKIVGLADETFVADIEKTCSDSVGYEVTATSLRDNGKYRSITIDMRIDSAQAFYRVYEDVGKDARVKFMI